MIKKALVFAITAACLTSGAAFAQSSDYRNDRNERNGRYEHNDRDGRYQRDGRDERYATSQRDYGRHDRYDRYDRNNRYYSRDYGYRHNGHGYQQRYQMRRGERFSQHYRGQHVVVSDWRRHRLHQPRYGHHWVQVGTDYALVAIATGIIAQVLLNH